MRYYLLGLALICLSLSAYLLGSKIMFWCTAQPATATVVGFKVEIDDKSRRYPKSRLVPQLVFVSAAGDSVRVESATGSLVPTYRLGQRVPLRYDPAQPRRAELPDFFDRWGAVLLATGLGLLGGVLLRVSRWFGRFT